MLTLASSGCNTLMDINQDIVNKDELFHQLYLKHVNDLKAYTRSLLPTWNDAEEVMQKVAIVIWRKFDDFDPETSLSNGPV